MIFLPIVFLLYWFVFNKDIKLQNLLIVAASYVFYGWWDWRFLSLIIFSSIVDYSIGLQLGKTDANRRRKLLLFTSLAVNLGLLGFFKYYNFFVEQFVEAFRLFGAELNPTTLSIILPVGISFYTFQTLSYTIDVYRRKLEPTKDWIAFFAYVSFFPQLVAGPIERATNLIPQFTSHRVFNLLKARDGMRQILWGLFKKIVIADNCATIVNEIFNNHETMPASALVLGSVLFAFQIYGDFSGYSDIAIGTARLFGFDLMRNFAYPYFSRDMAEFWRRWHISLSTWFRDYLYIPLGGSRVDKRWKLARNIAAIFIVSGFWHGANWTFIIWGTLNALYVLPAVMLKTNRKNLDIVAKDSLFPSLRDVFSILLTFALTCFAWIFFRAESVGHAFSYIANIADTSIFSISYFLDLKVIDVLFWIVVMVVIEWLNRRHLHPLENIQAYFKNTNVRYAIYTLIFIIILSKTQNTDTFIYFQF